MGLPKIMSDRSVAKEKLTADEVVRFMNKNGLSDKEMAEIFGVTIQCVRLWTSGDRTFTVTNSRLIKMFEKYPTLLREF